MNYWPAFRRGGCPRACASVPKFVAKRSSEKRDLFEPPCSETVKMEIEREVLKERSVRPRMKTSRGMNQSIPWWGYVLFAVLALVVTAKMIQHHVGVSKAGQTPARPVLVAKVVTRDAPLYLDEIGTCAAYETVQVQAQVSGQIIARHFQDGSDVKQGDLLFTIDPRPYQAALDQAKAQAALDQATLRRQTDLRARQVVAQQDWATAHANAEKSKAEAAADAAQVNLDSCSIKSPITGGVGVRNVDVGNLVGPSTPPLVTIQGLD